MSDPVEAFWAAVQVPLGPEDLANGWTEAARLASVDAMSRVRADLDKGWGDMADYASHHLMRSLDYWGIGIHGEGPLTVLAAAAQVALMKMKDER